MTSFEERVDPHLLAAIHAAQANPPADPPPHTPHPAVTIEDFTIPAPDNAPEIPIRIYRPTEEATTSTAALLWIHGGGFASGTHEEAPELFEQFTLETGAVYLSVGYRLAPEHPYPAGLNDCYTALLWLADHAADYNIDPERIAVGGGSSGACFATAIALMARDRGGPPLSYQFLLIPTLDDRMTTPSSQQITYPHIFNRDGLAGVWAGYLGDQDREQLSPYAAPARATDLSGLPPAYVMVEEIDPLRDEGIIYAMRLMQAGISTELHVFPGTFHGSFAVFRETPIAQRMGAEVLLKLKEILS